MDITSATIDSGNDFVSYDGVVNDMDVPKTGDADPVMNMKKIFSRFIPIFSFMIRAVSIYQH